MGQIASIFWTFPHLSNGQIALYYLKIPFLLVPGSTSIAGLQTTPQILSLKMFILLMNPQYGEGLVRTGGLSWEAGII